MSKGARRPGRYKEGADDETQAYVNKKNNRPSEQYV